MNKEKVGYIETTHCFRYKKESSDTLLFT